MHIPAAVVAAPLMLTFLILMGTRVGLAVIPVVVAIILYMVLWFVGGKMQGKLR